MVSIGVPGAMLPLPGGRCYEIRLFTPKRRAWFQHGKAIIHARIYGDRFRMVPECHAEESNLFQQAMEWACRWNAKRGT